MARSSDHDDDKTENQRSTYSPPMQGPAPVPQPMPAPAPVPTILSGAEQARHAELRLKAEGERSAEEKAEFEALEKKSALKPMPADQVVRLRDLRLLNERNQLNEADRGELAKLSAAESEAAGHTAPTEAKGPLDEGALVIYELLSFIEQMIARTPAYHDMTIRAQMLRNRLENPPDRAKAA